MKKDFKTLFKDWFDIVSFRDPQDYQDLDWDWSDELMSFYEDPDAAITAAKENFYIPNNEDIEFVPEKVK